MRKGGRRYALASEWGGGEGREAGSVDFHRFSLLFWLVGWLVGCFRGFVDGDDTSYMVVVDRACCVGLRVLLADNALLFLTRRFVSARSRWMETRSLGMLFPHVELCRFGCAALARVGVCACEMNRKCFCFRREKNSRLHSHRTVLS